MNHNRDSIIYKLRLVITISFVVFYIVVACIIIIQYQQQWENSTETQINTNDSVIAQSLKTRIENTNGAANSIIIGLSEEFGPGEYTDKFGPKLTSSNRKRIYKKIIQTFTTFYKAEQVMVLWNDGTYWYINWTENYAMQKDCVGLLSEIDSLNISKAGKWIMNLETDNRFYGEGPYFVKAFVDVDSSCKVGYVILQPGKIFDTLMETDRGRKLYLFGDNHLMLYSSDTNVLQKIRGLSRQKAIEFSNDIYRDIVDTGHRDKYIVLNKVQRCWELVSVNDLSGARRNLVQILAMILAILIAIMGTILLFVNHYLNDLLTPIRSLSRHMSEASDSLPEPLSIRTGNDESSILVNSFNSMTFRNRELLASLSEEKKRQEHLKFQLLQSQIKPHFLFNTLDAIYCLAEMGQNKKSAEMTRLLSDYYRHILSNGMEWVFLSEEVSQTKSYLQIESIRYRSILDYEVVMEDNVENILIPKLTIQPLVENAIEHGLKPMGKRGKLNVRITEKNHYVCINVSDNGVGLSQEKFATEISEKNPKREGFGLANVAERLSFYYEDRFEMKLLNAQQGTSILIRILVDEDDRINEIL